MVSFFTLHVITLKVPDLRGIIRKLTQLYEVAKYLLLGCEAVVPVDGRPAMRMAEFAPSSRRDGIGAH